MNPNTFGIDTAFPPNPQSPVGYTPVPPEGGYPVPPPGYPPLPPQGQPIPRPRRPRRWPAIIAAGVAGAVVASAVALGLSLQGRGTDSTPAQAAAPVTVTVPAPTAAPPVPLPTAQADSQTCRQGWDPAGHLSDEAIAALHRLPAGVRVGNPAIQSDPSLSAAVQDAASAYRRAADALEKAIAPGTTPVLAEAAHAMVNASRLLADAITKNDPINGNAGDIADASAAHIGLLCQRLAP